MLSRFLSVQSYNLLMKVNLLDVIAGKSTMLALRKVFWHGIYIYVLNELVFIKARRKLYQT
ncbi:MAG: hypothetical protein ACJAU1_000035 [Psychromonas sp.]|jgi:hypothetical protein